MEGTIATNSPGMSLQTHKRTERDLDIDDHNEASSANDNVSASKRFKSFAYQLNDEDCESALDVGAMLKSQSALLSEYKLNILSPVTEITKHLSHAQLHDGSAQTQQQNEDNAEVTPQKGLCSIARDSVHRFKQFQHIFNTEEISEATSTLTNFQKCQNDQQPKSESADKGFQMSAHRTGSVCRSNHTTTLNEMAMDEFSFYGDESVSDTLAQRSFAPSPQLIGLLSPEGSPLRFQVLENPAASGNKFVQNLQNGTQHTGTTSSNLSAKSIRMFHSLSSGSMESSMDDDYMELYEMDALEQHQQSSHTNINFPTDLTSLISGHIKNSSPAKIQMHTPEMRRPSVRRCLSMTENYQQHQPKTPELLKQALETASSTTPFASRLTVERAQSNSTTPVSSNCFKRPEPPSSTNCSPVQNKRYRSIEKENLAELVTTSTASTTPAQITFPTTLRKCISMNDAEILSALARSENKDQPDLIGDLTKPFVLPIMEGRHRDLKSISSDTVARLLKGEFNEQIASYKIIDCRYPYEYEGGHIRGAKNLYTQEQIFEEFLTQQKTEQNQTSVEKAGNKRNIIIFHCEFSSERGPKLSRFLRNTDRARNTQSYPTLDYPEIYLLHNGYKEFYETHAELCDPNSYRPMLEPAYNEAYRHFRSKSKSWNGDGIGGTSRLKKSRSRLLL